MTRILIVEDDSQLRAHLGELLQSQGYAVDTAETTEAAHKALQAGGADLMIVDVFLPGTDGLQLMLETKRAYPGIKIIITTGKEHLLHGKSIRLAITLGADKTLSKPFTTENLMECVRSALN